jgi:aspartate carbamoyltransferase regulatory subunit
MAEKTKADIYITYLDQILAGEKDFEPIEDEEIAKLILLAKPMIANNLSINSKMREKLRKQLLAQLNEESNFSMRSRNDDELDDDTLDYVAAGFERQAGEQKDICPYCGSRVQDFGGKCPFCHH